VSRPAGDDTDPVDRFVIVSTGRCGSTMLSDLINEEPETLVANEFLVPLSVGLDGAVGATLTGADYWSMLARPHPHGQTLHRIGAVLPGVRYPAHGRYADNLDDLPILLVCVLPAISADPDRLFDALAGQVPRFPTQTAGRHHQMLLDLLAALHGRRRWVERSGASCMLAETILRSFPTAGVVFLTRDPAGTAESMSRHPVFQLAAARYAFAAQYGRDPYRPDPDGRLGVDGFADVPAGLRRFLPQTLTAEALREWGENVHWFEMSCRFSMARTEQALLDRPPPALLRVRYEDLVDQPLRELTRLGTFLGFTDPSNWAAANAPRIRSAPTGPRGC